jgi:hypothetical protein
MAETLIAHRFWINFDSDEQSNQLSHQFRSYHGQSRVDYCDRKRIQEQEAECDQLHPEESLVHMMTDKSIQW